MHAPHNENVIEISNPTTYTRSPRILDTATDPTFRWYRAAVAVALDDEKNLAYENDLAGVHGEIQRFVTTIKGTTATYHFFELAVSRLDDDWLEKDARARKWVSFSDAVKLVAWKEELAQALHLSSLAPSR